MEKGNIEQTSREIVENVKHRIRCIVQEIREGEESLSNLYLEHSKVAAPGENISEVTMIGQNYEDLHIACYALMRFLVQA